MPNKRRRIIIDTNLFISFLITHNYDKLNGIIFSKEWLLIFSDELISELVEVARRPKFRRFFSLLDIEDLLITLYRHWKVIKIKTEVNICRDLKDDFLLALAIDGKADFLLTGDNDLLILSSVGKTFITTIANFQTII